MSVTIRGRKKNLSDRTITRKHVTESDTYAQEQQEGSIFMLFFTNLIEIFRK